jgi:ADP-ribose pyrophosphatase YjhB (NUDIX family)
VARITKVVAYITRESPAGGRELLVFDHRDYPEAGVQVPAGTVAGTVDEGEQPEEAVMREVTEETGLEGCVLLEKLAVYDWPNPETGLINERHVFHLAAPSNTAEAWTWVETDGGRVSELEGYVFLFRWVPLDGEFELAGDQGDYLHVLR